MSNGTNGEDVNVCFRASKHLVKALDRLARKETSRTGYPVERSKIIRRILSDAVDAADILAQSDGAQAAAVN
jgi:hypothetical protein